MLPDLQPLNALYLQCFLLVATHYYPHTSGVGLANFVLRKFLSLNPEPIMTPTALKPTLMLRGRWYALLAATALLSSAPANALPSYAQQTGLPCAQCHSIGFGPALTAYGRQFKLNAYALGAHNKSVPLALMAVVGQTRTSSDLPEAPEHYSTNNNFALNELTGFIAGRIGSHAGAFIEAAYSGTERHTAWGAFDVRYARNFTVGGHGIVGGITLNNNPTVSDLWNSTPVWSFPYTGSELAPTPGAAPILFDGISETVLGPTFYAMIDDRLYIEAGGFKSLSDSLLDNVGLSADDNSHVKGIAPYWRAALQFTNGPHYFSVGLLGLNVKQQPDSASPLTNRFNDFGFDATYQHTAADSSNLQANLSIVHESRHLDAAVNAEEAASASGSLDSRKLDVSWTYKQTWVAAGGIFDTSGSSDGGLYAPGEVDGSNNGKPDSRGYLVQLEYVPFGKMNSPYRPWLNVRVGLQYIGYSRFNGGNSNYDGFGRSAGDNNTLFGFVWVAL